MIYSPTFKRAIFLSLLSHLIVFTLFNLSSGKRFPQGKEANVFFWGGLLRNAQVSPPLDSKVQAKYLKRLKEFSLQRSAASDLEQTPLSSRAAFKPPLSKGFNQEKQTFDQRSLGEVTWQRKGEPSIIFHPLLPYGFTLYFMDREIAHVELMFNIVSSSLRNSILIKRKISSGNLEVDLLSMRYFGHYLFIQQAKFMPNTWQTVKIDLSAKEK